MQPVVAALFVRRSSPYKAMPGVDAYDIDRDARTFGGGLPVIAHPPCRAWGRLRQFSKPRHDERGLAMWAVQVVRSFGGVLEHPAHSSLWSAAELPLPGQRDSVGGWTYCVDQSWWGHPAPKRTWLYIVGTGEVPKVPFHLGVAAGRVELLGKAAREATPVAFASWLFDLAKGCRV